MEIRPFTTRGAQTIKQSLDYVSQYKHEYVGVEHLVLVFTAPENDIAVTKHEDLAATCAKIREVVIKEIETGDGDGSRSVPQTPAAKQVILGSMRIAESLGHFGVNPEHMFLALLDLESEPLVKKIVDQNDIEVGKFRDQLKSASELDRYRPPSIGPN